MATAMSMAIAWIILYVIIYVLFLTKNGKGERYTVLGCIMLVMNSIAGFWLADDMSAFIALIVTGVYTINIYANWQD